MDNDIALYQINHDRLTITFQIWDNKLYRRLYDNITGKELETVLIKDFSTEKQFELPKFDIE